ncbi:MAG: hypothetical protein COA78_24595 [Blastopirellula sp.]|nr:MAG: hypothetical protein COA78_24595 [Blastopirellula sp.]
MKPRLKKNRRASTTLIVMVTMVCATLIVTAGLSRLTTQSQSIRSKGPQAQTEAMLQAGFSLANAQLLSSADYQGETWNLESNELGSKATGVVQITVEAVPQKSKQRKITVQARYRLDEFRQTTITRSLIRQLPKQGDAS